MCGHPCTYGHVFVLPSRRLVRPAADDDFVTVHLLCQLAESHIMPGTN